MYVPATPSSLTLSGLLARMVASLFTSPLWAAEQADFRNPSSSKFWLAGAALVWQLHLRCSWQSMLLAVISTTSLISQITKHKTLDACTAALRSPQRARSLFGRMAPPFGYAGRREREFFSQLSFSSTKLWTWRQHAQQHSTSILAPAESGPCITRQQ
jgi:hypothetical protein